MANFLEQPKGKPAPAIMFANTETIGDERFGHVEFLGQIDGQAVFGVGKALIKEGVLVENSRQYLAHPVEKHFRGRLVLGE